MIEVEVNDRLGKKIRVKCMSEDLVGDFKKVLALQLGVTWNKIVLQKGGSVLKDHISLEDYEVHDGTYLELYYL
ncbi:LANO_0A01442g1_1 [Lachancea nothofagi CBS 11611]|uniref:Ubiquitin-like modifier HUB1 n=1 Tax=Lachancea nothofagi CBS 11611 TaxID=1266666 RepID=A0A1G4IMM7_9SACH|nr:LANO_0A01442g1_1 [Lachancea nothofagi CBS 11611]